MEKVQWLQEAAPGAFKDLCPETCQGRRVSYIPKGKVLWYVTVFESAKTVISVLARYMVVDVSFINYVLPKLNWTKTIVWGFNCVVLLSYNPGPNGRKRELRVRVARYMFSSAVRECLGKIRENSWLLLRKVWWGSNLNAWERMKDDESWLLDSLKLSEFLILCSSGFCLAWTLYDCLLSSVGIIIDKYT